MRVYFCSTFLFFCCPSRVRRFSWWLTSEWAHDWVLMRPLPLMLVGSQWVSVSDCSACIGLPWCSRVHQCKWMYDCVNMCVLTQETNRSNFKAKLLVFLPKVWDLDVQQGELFHLGCVHLQHRPVKTLAILEWEKGRRVVGDKFNYWFTVTLMI